VAGSGVELTSVLRPVRQGNAFEETVERLLTVIKLGMIAPGERFPAERELSGQLGISRLTLREAIRELAQAGYVESRRGRFGGTFITYTPPAPDTAKVARLAIRDGEKLADALTFRLAVESGAAETLAGMMTRPLPGPGSGEHWPLGLAADGCHPAGEYGRVREILQRRLAEVNAASPQDYRRLDTLFHLSVAELTGSGLLAAAGADARMRLNDLLNAIPVLQRNIHHTARQHTAIVEAILAGQPEQARRAVAEHLEGTAALLRGFLSL